MNKKTDKFLSIEVPDDLAQNKRVKNKNDVITDRIQPRKRIKSNNRISIPFFVFSFLGVIIIFLAIIIYPRVKKPKNTTKTTVEDTISSFSESDVIIDDETTKEYFESITESVSYSEVITIVSTEISFDNISETEQITRYGNEVLTEIETKSQTEKQREILFSNNYFAITIPKDFKNVPDSEKSIITDNDTEGTIISYNACCDSSKRNYIVCCERKIPNNEYDASDYAAAGADYYSTTTYNKTVNGLSFVCFEVYENNVYAVHLFCMSGNNLVEIEADSKDSYEMAWDMLYNSIKSI